MDSPQRSSSDWSPPSHEPSHRSKHGGLPRRQSIPITIARWDPVRNTLNGGASGTILEGTEHAPSFTASGTGHIHATGLGNITQVGAISGPAVVSFPPPLIGSYEAPFSASFAVDSTWKGTGKFSVGNDTYECQVERISY